jgi:glycosyltransferase involved in cell wall biosynthesis
MAREKKNQEPALLSIVIPAFNEEEVLFAFHQRLAVVLDSLDVRAEIFYVNDGSTDGTMNCMEDLRSKDPRVGILDLSRNFGKELAMSAGVDHSRGDAVVVIDADLQDPPEIIPELLAQWQKGFDVVYAQRINRAGEPWLKRATAHLFYRVMRRITRVDIPEDTGDFRLLSRRAVESLKRLREQHRFMKGLFAWIGYPQKGIPYYRDPRFAGRTKWNYWKLWNFALEGITSFTIAPLTLSTYLGLLTAFGAFFYAAFVIVKTLVFGDPVKGYPSLMVVILFLGGIQLFTIGVIGEYLGRMFDESKQRPLYLLKGFFPSQDRNDNPPPPTEP